MTDPSGPDAVGEGGSRLRLALALGDQEREQRLRPALDGDDDFLVVAQCLAADHLLDIVHGRQVDAVVVAWGLHRLSEPILAEIARSRLPTVALVPDPDAERWRALAAVTLPLDADAGAVRQGLKAAWRGERRVTRPSRGVPEAAGGSAAAAAGEPPAVSVIAVAGGHGSPGRTTVAINLATALGAVAPTVLVDADLSAPSIVAYLDRDPSRNLCTLAHGVRENSFAWSRVIADELQPIGPRSAHGVVLCGLPKREMRGTVSPPFVERLLAELRARHRFVVVDVGADILGSDSAASVHRTVLAAASTVLVVTTADLVSLWHARTTLGLLTDHLQLDRDQLNLVINRLDSRHHHGRAEIEWHLGVPAAAVVPHDYGAAQRAVAEQQPLVLDPTSRAGRALLGLAERTYRGTVRLPREEGRPSRTAWLQRWLPRRVSRRPGARKGPPAPLAVSVNGVGAPSGLEAGQ